MPDLSALAAALSSLNAAKDIAQAMIDLRDGAAFQAKLIEFQSKLLDANNAAFAAQDERAALLEQIRALEEKVASFETWDAEKKRYELKQFGSGAFAYALKPEAHGAEPMHQICANCYENRKKSILQIVPGNNARTALGIRPMHRCPSCHAEVAF